MSFLRTHFQYSIPKAVERLIEQNRIDWDLIYLEIVRQQIAAFAGGRGNWSSICDAGLMFWKYQYLSYLFKKAGKIPA
jgi:hypothetical protein